MPDFGEEAREMDRSEYVAAVDRLDRALATRTLEEALIVGVRPGTSEADRLAERIVGLTLRASRRSAIPLHQIVKLPLAEVARLAGE